MCFRYEPDLGAHAVDRAAVAHELLAVVIAQQPAEPVRKEVRVGEDVARILADADHHLGRVHLLDRRVAQQAAAAISAARELQPQPLGQVRHARVDRARGRDIVDVAPGDDPDGVVDLLVGRRDVAREGRDAGVGTAHAERRENPRLQEVAPGHPARCGDHLARREEHDVLIAVLRAEAPAGLQVAEVVQHLRAVEPRSVPHEVAARQAAAVRQQIAHRQLARDVRIRQLEPGEILGDGIVPRDLAGIDQHGERRRGERLGGGADGEQRVRVDAGGLAQLAHPVALAEHHGVVPDHSHRHPGHAPVTQRLLDVRVESAERRILRTGGRNGRSRRHHAHYDQ